MKINTRMNILLGLLSAKSTILPIVYSFVVPSKTYFSHHQTTTITTTTTTTTTSILQLSAGGGTTTQTTSGTKQAAPTVNDPKQIRNLAFVGHSHAGKTSLLETMLSTSTSSTTTNSRHRPTLDSDPTEITRHSSVFSHYLRIPHHTGTLLEIADTPWGDFPLDAIASLSGADGAVIVVSGSDGVQAGTVGAWDYVKENGIACVAVVSKVDREFVDVEEVLEGMEVGLGIKPVPLQLLMSDDEEGEKGVRSLLVLGEDGTVKRNEKEGLEEAWMTLVEAVAMTDDDLLVDYLETAELDDWQVIDGLRSAVRKRLILPVVYTSAEQDIGVMELMDSIVTVLPNPVEMREEAISAACSASTSQCSLEPGIEIGFAARVLHTTVDAFGSLSVLRVISNSLASPEDDTSTSYGTLPHDVINLRTGESIKLPSASNTVYLIGKERYPLPSEASIVPGDIIAMPKLPASVTTNDVLTVPSGAQNEETEIEMETKGGLLTPLSRPVEDLPLMACATISLSDEQQQTSSSNNKKRSNKRGGNNDEKLSTALKSLAREDLALRISHDASSGQLLLRGMSTDHLALIQTRLRDRYDLDVTLGRPPVPYRETLRKAVTNMEGRHKKQSGGSGQFGVCYINMEPAEEGSGVSFESVVKGGAISKPFIASVEKGVREQLASGGPLGGYPVTDVKVTLVDGKMHSVDSKDIAFRSAGKLAIKSALEKGGTVLLQPMEHVTFSVDASLQGDVNAIVSRCDGYVTSSSSDGGSTGMMEVEAILPGKMIQEVSDALRAATAGEGEFISVFSHYQPVPEDAVKDIVKNRDFDEMNP